MTRSTANNDSETRQTRRRPSIPRKWLFRSLVVIGLLVASVYFLPKLRYARDHETTDDAYVQGTVVPISPQLKGRIAQVFVTDNQQVAAGAPLLRLDPAEYRLALQQKQQELAADQAEERRLAAALDEARQAEREAAAKLQSAESAATFADREQKRYTALLATKVVAQRQYDQVANTADQARAELAAAKAARQRAQAAITALTAEQESWRFKTTAAARAVERAQLDLDRTLLTAPAAGRVAKKSAEVGKFVNPGQTVLTLVDDQQLWIEANYKETQIERIRPGQKVEIRVDAYPNLLLKGRVESLQPGTGSAFSLLPAENATGNFVKVVQRVPVRIAFNAADRAAARLRPGLSVVPSIAVR